MLLLLCVVCYNIALCYIKLAQVDAAEEALSQSLKVYTDLFPQGHVMISTSETTSFKASGVRNGDPPCCLVEQRLYAIWQLKELGWW